MAIHGISEQEHHRLLERIRHREGVDPKLANEQHKKLAGLFSQYNLLIRELETTIWAYRQAAAPVSARINPHYKKKTENV